MKRILVTLATIILLAGCKDAGTQPAQAPWKEVESFRSQKSGWLNFISVQADCDKPDSAKIVVVQDGRTMCAQELLGGKGSFIARFYFEPGYVGTLPAEPGLKLYVK